ncbi:MAG: TIGR03936 family radical SAM-associated protein [Eubacteriales bacterium]|nr:TIGR03936 family radical SAM-associated protein [Eubacteriales bacterium]
MTILRCKYTRGEEVKFISHLDLLRVFERAIRRAGLPIEHSAGYNPRPKIVFALPLPVGVTSDGEYADITLAGEYSSDDFIRTLNAELPQGIKLTAVESITQSKHSIMSEVESAKYELKADYEGQIEQVREIISAIMSKHDIIVEKNTGSGTKSINIRPLIKEMSVREQNSKEILRCDKTGLVIDLHVNAGSRENLRPDLAANMLEEMSGGSLRVTGIHRKQLLLVQS